MILQIIIVTHYFLTRIVEKGNRDEFCIILVDTFFWKGGEKIFFSSCVIRWKNVFIDQKVSWFKRLWICQYKRFQLKKANPNIKICWNCVAYIQCDYKRLLHGFSFFFTHAESFKGIAQTPFSKKKGKNNWVSNKHDQRREARCAKGKTNEVKTFKQQIF